MTKTKLKPFQEEGVRGIYEFRGRALLADEMGLGKTIQALCWIYRLPKRRPAIIVVPASVKYNWQHEAWMHFGMRAEVLEGKRKEKHRRLEGDIIVLNYDIMESWLPLLLEMGIGILVFDEVHYLKNPQARRTKAAFQLAEDVPSVLGLSGTPLVNRPIELWTILKIIKPNLYPSMNKYAYRYCAPRYTPWGWVYDGATNIPELNRVLTEHCMIRRLKKDVLSELPPKIRTVDLINLRSYADYNRAEADFINWLKAKSPAKAAKAKKSEALVKIGYLLRLVAQLKKDQSIQWVKDFFNSNPGEKLVMMTMHTFIVDDFHAAFENSVIIDGRVTGTKRQDTVRQFQNNPKTNLLIGNWQAAGVGITLTASSTFLGHDLPWTPGALLQGEDRIHRIGQKNTAMIHYLAVMRTIEEKLVNILQKKASVLDAVLNGSAAEEDLDIFGELLDKLGKPA